MEIEIKAFAKVVEKDYFLDAAINHKSFLLVLFYGREFQRSILWRLFGMRLDI